jgi:hypothetical protein
MLIIQGGDCTTSYRSMSSKNYLKLEQEGRILCSEILCSHVCLGTVMAVIIW